jgi:hypothetical protein
MPGLPVWGPAGFAVSTLWLVWLIILGIRFLKIRVDERKHQFLRQPGINISCAGWILNPLSRLFAKDIRKYFITSEQIH